MNLWMDTAPIRWTVRHKQHIRQALDEADAENAAEQNTLTEAPVAPCVADQADTADTDTPYEESTV